MKIVGIVCGNQESEILKTLKMMLTKIEKKPAVLKSNEIQNEEMLTNLQNSGLDVLLVKIDQQLKNKFIDYDIILTDNENEIFLDRILTIKKGCTVMIVNSDVPNNIVADNVKKVNVITYGLNPKASITASSINEENFMCSVQRKLTTYDENEIEPCEFSVPFITEDIYKILACICVFMVLNYTLF